MSERSQVKLYNRALNACGLNNTVSAPDEESVEARTCERHFEDAVRFVLSAGDWPSARATAVLPLVDINLHKMNFNSFTYAYALPKDFIHPRYLESFMRFDLGATDNQRVLLTDDRRPVLVYNREVTNIALWDETVYSAIIAVLAAYICMPLTADAARTAKLENRASGLILTAQVNTANARSVGTKTLPGWIAARGFSDYAGQEEFIYPFASGSFGGAL